MRFTAFAVACAAVGAAVALPQTAATTGPAAVCGGTQAQWVGSFSGTVVETVDGDAWGTPVTATFTLADELDVVVTQGGPNNVYYRSGDIELGGGNIWWRSIDVINDVTFLVTEFDSTGVTCGSDGGVAEFSGDTTSRCCGSPGEWYGEFVLTRTA